MIVKLRFIFVGKSRDNYIKEGINKYYKILKKYGSIEIIETKSAKDKLIKKILNKEKDLILNNIKKDFYTILLDLKGENFSTEKFANFLENNFNKGINRIQFIIGGAYGVDNELFNYANLILKLSDLTFNHQIVRILLLEQVYRVLSIINGENYHH